MVSRLIRPLFWVGLMVFMMEVTVSAQESKEAAKDVPLPKMPDGIGKVDANAPKTFTTTNSGLKYRVLRKGEGSMPKATSKVRVNYHGWLDNGKVFDSSYQRREPISFGLNQVIPGWTEGMQMVGEGGLIELEIPANLGYGDRGAPPVIPGGATLHFLVELLKIEK